MNCITKLCLLASFFMSIQCIILGDIISPNKILCCWQTGRNNALFVCSIMIRAKVTNTHFCGRNFPSRFDFFILYFFANISWLKNFIYYLIYIYLFLSGVTFILYLSSSGSLMRIRAFEIEKNKINIYTTHN